MHSQKSRSSWIAAGIIAALFICFAGAAMAAVLGLALLGSSSTADTLEVTVEALPILYQDDAFDLIAHIENAGDVPVTVTQIDVIHGSLAASTGIEPAAPVRSIDRETTAYDPGIVLQPGASTTLRVHLQALQTGSYPGRIRVWTGNRQREALFSMLVRPAEERVSNLYRSVVMIAAQVELNGETRIGWTGSGTIVSPDGLILTNAHVVLPDRYYDVTGLVVYLTVDPSLPPQPKYKAEVMQADVALDIAVLRLTTDMDGNPVDTQMLNLPAARLGNADTLQLGDRIIILGYPGIGGSTITLTSGEVAGFTAESGVGPRAFIKTSATIAGGNSGGLAANLRGELIGIPTQLGYGGNDQFVDCRILADTNRDGIVDKRDACVPTGGFINALRPINLALPYIGAARRGETAIVGVPEESTYRVEGEILYQDDFSHFSRDWNTGSTSAGSRYYEQDALMIHVQQAQYVVWSTYKNWQGNESIVQVSVQVKQSTGKGGFGVICQYVDNQNFYALEVTEDGYFSIWKYADGQDSYILDWQFSNHIRTNAPVRLTAECLGNRFKLAFNDVLLADVVDHEATSTPSGDIGLFANAWEVGGLIVAFDDFVLARP